VSERRATLGVETEQIGQSRRLATIRGRLLDTGLSVFVGLGLVALLSSLLRARETGWQPVMAMHALILAMFGVTLALRNRFPHRPRAAVFVGGLLLAGFGGLWTYGLAGMGIFLIALGVLFSAMLLEQRQVIAVMGIALAGFIAVATAAVKRLHRFDVDFNAYMQTPSAWITAIATLATVTAAIVGLQKMNLSLTGAIRSLAERTDQLAENNLALRDEIAARVRAEEHLFEEKEKAQITLQSIGDAVITTDSDCRVTYLNAASTAITGWEVQEARGRPIEEVFHIVDEQSREPVEQPVRRCLKKNEVVALANGVVLLHRDGGECIIRDSAAPIRKRNGDVIGAVLIAQDATRERMMLREAQHNAAHDSLTGLINRREFEIRLERAIKRVHDANASYALCYLDLDRFKLVNDVGGHQAGDAVLRSVAARLENQIRARDSLARLGGDEFGLLLESCTVDEAYRVGAKLVEAISEKSFHWRDEEFQISVSIGVVGVTDTGEGSGPLLRQADAACYAAKDLGRNRVVIYERRHGGDAGDREERRTVVRLREALEGDGLTLYKQPIYRLGKEPAGTGTPPLYEVLVRLNTADEPLLPGTFIPIAERVGLMPEIDRWVIRNALTSLSKEDSDAQSSLSINLSGATLNDESLSSFIRRELARTNVSPRRVCFEITETAAIENEKRALAFIEEMRELGCRFALDDFGSGVSSLSHLKRLPVDYLKIDGQFVREIDASPTDRAMVKAICELGRTLDIRMIAEYVETEQVATTLTDLGVDYAQGFLLGRPKPLV